MKNQGASSSLILSVFLCMGMLISCGKEEATVKVVFDYSSMVCNGQIQGDRYSFLATLVMLKYTCTETIAKTGKSSGRKLYTYGGSGCNLAGLEPSSNNQSVPLSTLNSLGTLDLCTHKGTLENRYDFTIDSTNLTANVSSSFTDTSVSNFSLALDCPTIQRGSELTTDTCQAIAEKNSFTWATVESL